jgi:hypothetical protein
VENKKQDALQARLYIKGGLSRNFYGRDVFAKLVFRSDARDPLSKNLAGIQGSLRRLVFRSKGGDSYELFRICISAKMDGFAKTAFVTRPAASLSQIMQYSVQSQNSCRLFF